MPPILMSQLFVLFLRSVKDVFGLFSFLPWLVFVFWGEDIQEVQFLFSLSLSLSVPVYAEGTSL